MLKCSLAHEASYKAMTNTLQSYIEVYNWLLPAAALLLAPSLLHVRGSRLAKPQGYPVVRRCLVDGKLATQIHEHFTFTSTRQARDHAILQ
jgi:hypothetical protein